MKVKAHPSHRKSIGLGFGLIALILAVMVWADDWITLQGERTIFTVKCSGAWKDGRCEGNLQAAERYRFRALKPHGEVVFWTVGGSDPSGKYNDCKITDGRNWICKPSADAKRTITLEIKHGIAVQDSSGQTLSFHAVPKWRWWLLNWGLPAGSSAIG